MDVPVNFRIWMADTMVLWVASVVGEEVCDVVWSWTPLHLACYLGYAEIADRLIAAGARVGSRDCTGRRPFSYAPKREEFREILIFHGLDESQFH